ncbi:hypothetical protein [Pseudomonas putida]|uniref:hypothetical protein n=1 Tax=Pseudomonas putida TaxID=303 RepID=UPI001E29A725|nr:hypothetical protein [Pseudomonas putida]
MSGMAGQYQKGDVRKLLRIALATADLESPTLNNLAKETGFHKQTLINDLERLQSQMGVVINKDGYAYRLVSWGPILAHPDKIRAFLNMPVAAGASTEPEVAS